MPRCENYWLNMKIYMIASYCQEDCIHAQSHEQPWESSFSKSMCNRLCPLGSFWSFSQVRCGRAGSFIFTSLLVRGHILHQALEPFLYPSLGIVCDALVHGLRNFSLWCFFFFNNFTFKEYFYIWAILAFFSVIYIAIFLPVFQLSFHCVYRFLPRKRFLTFKFINLSFYCFLWISSHS